MQASEQPVASRNIPKALEFDPANRGHECALPRDCEGCERYVCRMCERTLPWDFGAADDVGMLCDDCFCRVEYPDVVAGERVLIMRAAIRAGGNLYVVERPGRHSEIIVSFGKLWQHLRAQSGAVEQGFITSTGKFVDRWEAASLGVASGQLPHYFCRRRNCFSQCDLVADMETTSEDFW